MKKVAISTLVLASMLSAPVVIAQQKTGDMKCCKGMKDMDMGNMDMGKQSAPGMKTHHAVGVVKAVDATAGTVTLAHEPVKSLNWPAMTMAFKVKDKTLLDKLAADRKVEFEFVHEGKDYVVTAVN